MKVEIHILQNFPPANLNRDDTGSPKDCFFGGVRRARISSQCLKRSVRTSSLFEEQAGADLGVRTKRIPAQIANRLSSDHGVSGGEARALAETMIRSLLSLSNDGEAEYLVFIGKDELDELAALLADTLAEAQPHATAVEQARQQIEAAGDDMKAIDEAQKALGKAEKALDKIVAPLAKDFVKTHEGHVKAIDVALFGRMLAHEPKLNIDAACQVAHAVSVNAVQMEFDYYTAVDDLKQQEQETGAGMIGTVAYNSSTFYRYAVADLDQLTSNLSGDREAALQGIQAFLHAFIHARPSGKQNSFAAHTPPSLVLAVARPNGMPFSLADAFEDPISPNGQGLIAAAVEKLDGHWGAITSAYPLSEGTIVKVKAVEGKGTLEKLAPYHVATVPAVIDELIAVLQGGAEGTV